MLSDIRRRPPASSRARDGRALSRLPGSDLGGKGAQRLVVPEYAHALERTACLTAKSEPAQSPRRSVPRLRGRPRASCRERLRVYPAAPNAPAGRRARTTSRRRCCRRERRSGCADQVPNAAADVRRRDPRAKKLLRLGPHSRRTRAAAQARRSPQRATQANTITIGSARRQSERTFVAISSKKIRSEDMGSATERRRPGALRIHPSLRGRPQGCPRSLLIAGA